MELIILLTVTWWIVYVLYSDVQRMTELNDKYQQQLAELRLKAIEQEEIRDYLGVVSNDE